MIAKNPPMGWNSWDCYGSAVTEEQVKANADYMAALLQMFVRNGYSFVTLETALKDELYKTEDHFYKNGGISWLDRWAITQGKSREFFEGDPVCPGFIMKLAKVDSE